MQEHAHFYNPKAEEPKFVQFLLRAHVVKQMGLGSTILETCGENLALLSLTEFPLKYPGFCYQFPKFPQAIW